MPSRGLSVTPTASAPEAPACVGAEMATIKAAAQSHCRLNMLPLVSTVRRYLSHADLSITQKSLRSLPAVAAQNANARSSAVSLSAAMAKPTPGVPALGSIAMATHSPRNVPTTVHSDLALGGAAWVVRHA